ncbi:unnamed protein product [Toxocara canis]|uniref:Kelch domain-containing protein n=1 Tax=Toxocara canis TaxID=6265 RepID=A0A183UJ12_TOXCA|nr:unnamed protein product [Toxocara canis]
MFAGPPPGSQFAWEAASPSYEVVEDEEGQNGRAVVGHSMVNYQGSLLVWGGYSHGVGDEIHYRPTNQIYVLPAALTTRDHGVQLQGHTSMLFKLDLDLERWSTCEPRENELIPTPRDKTTGWVHQNRCYFFGGYGPHANDTENPLLYLRRGGEYFADENNEFYWNNQLLVYDSSASMNWTVADVSGSVPSARAASSSAYFADRGYVLLFGGRHGDVRLCDLYLLDMRTLIWTNVEMIGQPNGRSWCSLTAIDRNSALLYGGFSTGGLVLSDCWRVDISVCATKRTMMGRWTRVSCLKEPSPRLWHTAAFVDGLLFVCGGSDGPLSMPMMNCSKVVRVQISPPSLVALCFSALSHHLHDVSALPYFIRNRFRWLLYLRSQFAVTPPERANFRSLSLGDIIALCSLR